MNIKQFISPLGLIVLLTILASCSKTSNSDFRVKNDFPGPIILKYENLYDSVQPPLYINQGVDTLLYNLSFEVSNSMPDADFEREYIIKILSIEDTLGNPVSKNLNKSTEWEYVRDNNKNVYTLRIDASDW